MLSIMGLLSTGPGVVSGRIAYRRPGSEQPIDLLEGLERYARYTPGAESRVEKDDRGWQRWHDARMRPLRGRDLAMIFQNPRSALHPYFKVGQQITEAVRRGNPGLGAREARERAVEWLAKVHIDAPRRRLYDYPHNLSGGMCQRVMVAMALAARPAVLIADEPTTGLDATVQSRVLDLLEEMKAELGTTTVVVTHDIGVARRLADRVAIMYAGRIVEQGPAGDVLSPDSLRKHPYTRGLLRSVPTPEDVARRARLRVIQGDVPDLSRLEAGCQFAPRCSEKPAGREERCHDEEPALELVSQRHEIRCWLHHPDEKRQDYD